MTRGVGWLLLGLSLAIAILYATRPRAGQTPIPAEPRASIESSPQSMPDPATTVSQREEAGAVPAPQAPGETGALATTGSPPSGSKPISNGRIDRATPETGVGVPVSETVVATDADLELAFKHKYMNATTESMRSSLEDLWSVLEQSDGSNEGDPRRLSEEETRRLRLEAAWLKDRAFP